jgi:hypothetical protein
LKTSTSTSWIIDGKPAPTVEIKEMEIREADLVIILQGQSALDMEEIERSARLVLDTCGVAAQGELL